MGRVMYNYNKNIKDKVWVKVVAVFLVAAMLLSAAAVLFMLIAAM